MDNPIEPKLSSSRILTIPLRISLGLLLVAFVFKLMHWQGGNHLFISSLVLLFVLYPIRFFAKKPKRLSDHLKLYVVLTWVVSTCLITQHMPYGMETRLIFAAFMLLWILVEAYEIFILKMEKTFFNRPWWWTTAAILIFLGIGNSIFATNPFSNLYLITGLAILCGGLLVDIRKKGK